MGIQYAILDAKNGLYFRNTGYGGRWSKEPKLWSRRGDAVSCMKSRASWWAKSGVAAVVIPMTVKPL